MDYRERSERYLFWRQLIISLTAIGLVYILFIRPIQSFAVREFILPAFDSFIKPDSDIITSRGRYEFFSIFINGYIQLSKNRSPFQQLFLASHGFDLAYKK